jgi:hypothetical protein
VDFSQTHVVTLKQAYTNGYLKEWAEWAHELGHVPTLKQSSLKRKKEKHFS